MLDSRALREKRMRHGTLSWATDADEIIRAVELLEEWERRLENFTHNMAGFEKHDYDACRFCLDQQVLKNVKEVLGHAPM